ncbi:MAG: ribonuclease III [Firmicutes bacterium]|nr:ribonuclease III [Bacillota bacterium]MBR0481727.1 ribonuclease III [Bacillota bacterium]
MDKKDCGSLTLAFLGDAVYELFIRERVIGRGSSPKVDILNRESTRYVNAGAQARAIKAMIDGGFLSEEEISVAKRARNHRTSTKAKNADPVDYKWATALEALIGWLKLNGQENRMTEIMEEAARITETQIPISS